MATIDGQWIQKLNLGPKRISMVGLVSLLTLSCQSLQLSSVDPSQPHPEKMGGDINPQLTISRADYLDKLEGFWLGACIANWTGLVTEMDKVGNMGEFKTGAFYTRAHWG